MPNPQLNIETNRGTITVELWPEVAPKACENFLTHARNGYYNGTIFHRVIPGFMIQGGDPTGTGRGGESIWEKPFEDECPPDVTFEEPGLLAMANAGRGTNGSQFFITLAATTWLNGKHTIFGKVLKGYGVVEKIVEAPRNDADRPKKDQKIEKVTLKDAE